MLGVITIVAIQRAIQKILIAVFLSREFKHDETNRAWWSGKWYGRGLGNSAISQPAREFIVKIVEMSLWSSDFLLGHILLIILTVPVLIPFVDRLHSTMLCRWIKVLVQHSLKLSNSLAATIQADSRTSVFYEAEEAASLDSECIYSLNDEVLIVPKDHQVHHPLHYNRGRACIVGCPA